MVLQHESVGGRDELIADGEDDRSTIESKDDAALLVSRSKATGWSRSTVQILLTRYSEPWVISRYARVLFEL